MQSLCIKYLLDTSTSSTDHFSHQVCIRIYAHTNCILHSIYTNAYQCIRFDTCIIINIDTASPVPRDDGPPLLQPLHSREGEHAAEHTLHTYHQLLHTHTRWPPVKQLLQEAEKTYMYSMDATNRYIPRILIALGIAHTHRRTCTCNNRYS